MRKITFSRNKGIGYPKDIQVIEVDDDATENEINKLYEDWIWNEVADEFTWYEEGRNGGDGG